MNNKVTAFNTSEARATIAANFSAEMKRHRWTGRSMATALGLTQPYVARRASGEVELSGSDLALFSGFLNVPVTAFFIPVDNPSGVTGLDTSKNANHDKSD